MDPTFSFRNWLALESRDEHGEWAEDVRALLERYDSVYPRAGGSVEGFEVRPDVPNASSISSSLDWYEEMRGVRVVPTAGWPGCKKGYASVGDIRRCERLAEELRHSRSINPLIVVEDGDPPGQPWILEGGHRSGAMVDLGVSHVPALVVLDLEKLLGGG